MKIDRLYRFQEDTVGRLRKEAARNTKFYLMDNERNYVISLQAPTGSGKTIIMTSFIEDVYHGSAIPDWENGGAPEVFLPMPNAIFVWLSDSPALNQQSRDKIDLKSDKIRLDQCVTISEDSFDAEMLEDGHIYFLNTQKLSVKGKLCHHSDGRSYTIWETLDNTVQNKADHLYFIIDEAHRGMLNEGGQATSIMQRFIKGFPGGGMRPMPVVIGISATAKRFNDLVGNCPNSQLFAIKVSPADVRSSGLLKERISVMFPEDPNKYNDIAVLQAATEEWLDKCKHWYQYTYSQHYENVDPVFVIQVEKGQGKTVSKTDLDVLLKTIEDVQGKKFLEHEVVHTFGSFSDITINGLTVHHVEPEHISDDHTIKLVLFKEALTTGWDCPRAETMVSFCKADDPTYIAQLLGRMIRTPRGSRINVDESLNEVRLYLPFFNKVQVDKILKELKNNEGEDIPVDIDKDSMEYSNYKSYTVHPRRKEYSNPNQGELAMQMPKGDERANANERRDNDGAPSFTPSPAPTPAQNEHSNAYDRSSHNNDWQPSGEPDSPKDVQPSLDTSSSSSEQKTEQIPLVPEINRAEILKFINSKGYLTYSVSDRKINDFLTSLMDLASLLTTRGIHPEANNEIKSDIIGMIHAYGNELREAGVYKKYKEDIKQMKLFIQTYDVFGEHLNQSNASELFITDAVIDNQAEIADASLGRHNYVNAYITRYMNTENMDPQDCKVDCILFALDDSKLEELYAYAKKKFYEFDNEYRCDMADYDEEVQKKYKKITADAAQVSESFLVLPEHIRFDETGGQTYYRHLYVDEESGVAKIKFDSNWESATIEAEKMRDDFVCWLRNKTREKWALAIPYTMNGKKKAMYPDFLIVRSDPKRGYVVDILEPHGGNNVDNLPKAKGLAEYATKEKRMKRIQMIRLEGPKGSERIIRLDFTKREVREAVMNAMNEEDLYQIFKNYGTKD